MVTLFSTKSVLTKPAPRSCSSHFVNYMNPDPCVENQGACDKSHAIADGSTSHSVMAVIPLPASSVVRLAHVVSMCSLLGNIQGLESDMLCVL